jgi:hypothetical protein
MNWKMNDTKIVINGCNGLKKDQLVRIKKSGKTSSDVIVQSSLSVKKGKIITKDKDKEPTVNNVPNSCLGNIRGKMLYEFKNDTPGIKGLKIGKGTLIDVKQVFSDKWSKVSGNGSTGLVPTDYYKIVDKVPEKSSVESSSEPSEGLLGLIRGGALALRKTPERQPKEKGPNIMEELFRGVIGKKFTLEPKEETIEKDSEWDFGKRSRKRSGKRSNKRSSKRSGKRLGKKSGKRSHKRSR